MDMLTFYIYFILYVTTMVLIFVMSFIMLCPATKVIFKAPVPYIHDTIGKLLIPWGMTYVIFLPVIYMGMTGMADYEHAYVLASLVTVIMCISTNTWSFSVCTQQRVRQTVVQPLILTLPTVLTVWYAAGREEWLLQAFMTVCVTELLLLMVFYVKLYRAFKRDVKENYSSVSESMFHGFKILMGASVLLLLVFAGSAVYNNFFWDVLNMLTNGVVLGVYVYVSENLMPLPESVEDNPAGELPDAKPAEVDAREALETTIGRALEERCEKALLFCNPELSLHDLAMALGTNRTYLSKWFVRNDTTFYSYVNGLRAEYAGRLLLETDKTISQVMTDAGFMSKSTFRKYFVNRYGCLPTEFKKLRN